MSSEYVEEIKQFVGDNDTKLDILERIIEYESNNKDKQCTFRKYDNHGAACWSPMHDISMQPYYIGALKGASFIEIVNDTNSHTNLSLSSLEAAEQAYDDLKHAPDKMSDEWIKNNVNKENTTITEAFSDIEIDESDIEEIKDIVRNNNALDYWVQYVAPSLKYRELAKKAILVMLASPEDKYGTKGRINIKIYGPPGTGKSSLKKYMVKKFGALSIDGPRVSKADLTFNKNSEEFGILPKAHKGIVVIEEADEMDEDALGSTLTSLGESGQVEIRDMTIPAETRGIMLSNFETEQEIMNKWSPESLNRFDFVIRFDLLSDDQKDDALDDIYDSFRKPPQDVGEKMLIKYLKIARQFEPDFEEMDEIKDFKAGNIDRIQNIREGISVLNVAWTIARLNLEDVKLSHYKRAYNLVVSNELTLKEKFSS